MFARLHALFPRHAPTQHVSGVEEKSVEVNEAAPYDHALKVRIVSWNMNDTLPKVSSAYFVWVKMVLNWCRATLLRCWALFRRTCPLRAQIPPRPISTLRIRGTHTMSLLCTYYPMEMCSLANMIAALGRNVQPVYSRWEWAPSRWNARKTRRSPKCVPTSLYTHSSPLTE